jgi:hypothetical protein
MKHMLPLSAAIALAFVTGPVIAAESYDVKADRAALSNVKHRAHRAACAEDVAPQHARCFARIVTDDVVNDSPSGAPSGYGPADFQSAYGLPTAGGHGKVVAVIDAYDVPNAESDLAAYRTKFGLSPCTTANGCFRKVNQTGGSDLPDSDKNWAGETTLDIEMVSAACPDCGILLVEASSDYIGDLWAALTTAVKRGAAAATNSYGFAEVSEVTWVEPYFDFPGVLVTASSGDSGYSVQYPASSIHVLAVGGTTLQPSTSSRGWAESAWSSGGSGCSAFVPKPTWQKNTGCANRMEVDVAAVADPDTGVAVYCTDCGDSHQGWQIMGGTSVAAPLVAAAFTVLGVSADPSFPSAHSADFFDIVQGSNGTCETSSFCTAGPGYDGPTGWGTLNGSLLAQLGGAGTSGSQPKSDAGGVTTPANGTDAGTAKVVDAGRDTGEESAPDAASRATEDAATRVATGVGSKLDAAAKTDAAGEQSLETHMALDGGPVASEGDGAAAVDKGGFMCSLDVRTSRTSSNAWPFLCLAATALARRRKRSA